MTMIKKLAVLATATAAFAATPAAAQDASDSTGTASINVVTPMTLTKNEDLNFGTVILSGGVSATFTGAIVSMDDADGRTCDADLTCAGTGATSANYTFTASEGADVSLTIPTSVAISNGTDPDLTVDLEPENSTDLSAVSGITSADNSTFEFAMPSGGSLTFGFGGQIALDYNTPDGLYSGPILVTAEYK